jgi:tellurite resistance protein
MQSNNETPGFLEFFPVSFFGAIMGLAGLSFCWGWAEKAWHVGSGTKSVIGAITVVLFVVLTITYLIKWRKYPLLVKAEFAHPVSISFFGTFIISLLLVPGIILPYSKNLAIIIWSLGALLMFVFAWFVLRKWLSHQQDPGNAYPAWLIPIVGTLDVPIVGNQLPIYGIHEICILFYGIGILFAIILSTIIMSRLLFQTPLPEPLQPTLLILIAPFALAFSGYDSLTGVQDLTGSIFYYFDLFLLLVLGSRIILIPACCPFRVTWWSVSFPLVAFTIASFRYASHRNSVIFQIIPAVMLAISTLTISYLLVITFYKIFTNQLLLKPVAEKATQQLKL